MHRTLTDSDLLLRQLASAAAVLQLVAVSLRDADVAASAGSPQVRPRAAATAAHPVGLPLAVTAAADLVAIDAHVIEASASRHADQLRRLVAL